MVLTLLRGLGGKFCHMVSILKMHRLFPTFAEARAHLLLEDMEIDARPLSSPSALVTTTPRPAAPGAPAPPRPEAPPPAPPWCPTANAPAVVAVTVEAIANSRANQRPWPGGTPSAGQGGAPPGMHLSFVHPWAGTMRLWPYDQSGRPPPPLPVFSDVPQYNSFGGASSAYGGIYGAPSA